MCRRCRPGSGLPNALAMSVPRTLLLIEPDLRSFRGHMYRYASALATAAPAFGLRLVVVCHEQVEPAIRATLEQRGASVLAWYAGNIAWDMQCPEWRTLVGAGWRFARVARRAARRFDAPLIVTLSGRLPLLLGAAFVARSSPYPSILQLIKAHYHVHGGNPIALTTASTALRFAARLAVRCNVRFACLTDEMHSTIEHLLACPAVRLPFLLDWPQDVPQCRRNSVPIGAILGCDREEKGLEQLIEALRAGPVGCRWLIHQSIDHERHKALRAMMMRRGDIEFRVGRLSESEYQSVLQSSDFVVLPYDPSSYRSQASGILLEAVGYAAVPLVPVGTTMASICKRDGIGVVYGPYTAASLRAAIVDLLQNLTTHREAVRERSQC